MFREFDVFYDTENLCFQLRTKTNCYTLDFDDEVKKAVFERLIEIEDDDLPKAFHTLVKAFDKDKVIDVFSSLRDNGLLPYRGLSEVPELAACPTPDSPASQELASLEDLHVLVVSDSDLGHQLLETLQSRNVKNVKLISASLFASFSTLQAEEALLHADFIFADASAWNPAAMDQLNKTALANHKPWLYIGGVEEYHMKIGPLFLGNETGCYDCLISRIKSNHGYVPYFNAYEKYLSNSMKSARPDQFIHLDGYNRILAEYAYLEFTKFFQFWSVPATWRRVLVINMLNFETHNHDLLKVPFCESCNPNYFYNPSPWLEPISLSNL